MFIGNLMLLMLNLPLIALFARVTRMPYRHLIPVIVVAYVWLSLVRASALRNLVLTP